MRSPIRRSTRARGLHAASVGVLTIFLASGGLVTTPATGEEETGSLDQLVKVAEDLKRMLSPDHAAALSSGGQFLLNLAEVGPKIKTMTPPPEHERVVPSPAPPGYANDPNAADDFITREGGMTQSETSVSWCGSNALIGFNDSGSFADTTFRPTSPSRSLSFNGWAQSTDAGESYTDMGVLQAEPPAGVLRRDLEGDPVLGCSTNQNFYYASLATDIIVGNNQSDVTVSTSTDGGTTFPTTTAAVRKPAATHFLDKEWLAVVPGSTPATDTLHVTYTDFDSSGTSTCGPGVVRTAIEYVRSADGGTTWSAPQEIERVCGPVAFEQGSQITTEGNNVFVAWEHYATFQTRDIRSATSTNGGNTFGAPVVVSSVTPNGDSRNLQGNFRTFIDLKGLVVNSKTNTLTVSWADGRFASQFDPFLPDGGNHPGCLGVSRYCFGDVLISQSTDAGANWSPPFRIVPEPPEATDKFFPTLEVDTSGTLWILFYDREEDPRNFLIDTVVGTSYDDGRTWNFDTITDKPFPPITGWQDVFVNTFYMGDYISVGADKLGEHLGVITAWGDNSLGDQNVRQALIDHIDHIDP